MNETAASFLIATVPLWVLVLVALGLTLGRKVRSEAWAGRKAGQRLFFVGIGLQCLHATEEYATGFPERYPKLLGLTPWPGALFVSFNLAWIAFWVLAATGLPSGRRITFFPAWFFALGMVMNLVAHPALALLVGGYFPGLVTSPAVGVAGVLLLRRLVASTEGGHTSDPGSRSSGTVARNGRQE